MGLFCCQAHSSAIVPSTIPIHTIVADSAEATGLKWAAPSGGGKILQVVSGNYTPTVSTSSTTLVDINAALNLNLACSATSSKVLILAHFNELYISNGDRDIRIAITAGGTVIQQAEAILIGSTGEDLMNQDLIFVYSPSSTSSIQYKMQFCKRTGTGSVEVNQNAAAGGSTLTLMEIGA